MKVFILSLIIISLIVPISAQTPNPDNPDGPVAASGGHSQEWWDGYNDGYNGDFPFDSKPHDYWHGYDTGAIDVAGGKERKEPPKEEDPPKEEPPKEEETPPEEDPNEKGRPSEPLPRPPSPIPPIIMDTGDPLTFSLKQEACTYKAYPEMHPSRLTTLLVDGEQYTMSRIPCDETFILAVDFDNDGEIKTWHEILYNENIVYQNMKIMDTNQNGYFDYADAYWNNVIITDFKKTYTPEDLGILGFQYKGYLKTINDMHGNGVYADCLYQGELKYAKCFKVSEQSGFRIMGYHETGVITTHGTYPSYASVIGSLD